MIFFEIFGNHDKWCKKLWNGITHNMDYPETNDGIDSKHINTIRLKLVLKGEIDRNKY